MVKKKEIDMEVAFQVEALKKELEEKDRLLKNAERTLWEYGIGDVTEISDEEYICISQIEKLRQLSETCVLDEKEVRTFDLLNKNLRMIRAGVEKKVAKGQPKSAAELLAIVDGGKKK